MGTLAGLGGGSRVHFRRLETGFRLWRTGGSLRVFMVLTTNPYGSLGKAAFFPLIRRKIASGPKLGAREPNSPASTTIIFGVEGSLTMWGPSVR
jgi:hypothetical protein